MNLLRLSRTLATRASNVAPVLFPLPREHTQNVLNASHVLLAAQVDSDYKLYKMTNYDTKIRVSLFLQAVFSHNVSQALRMLLNFREKCKGNKETDAYARNVEVYMLCKSALIHYMASEKSKAVEVSEVLVLVAEMLKVPRPVKLARKAELRESHLGLIVILLKSLRATPNKERNAVLMLRIQILEFARAVKLDSEEVYSKLRDTRPELVEQFNLVWKQNKPLGESVQEDTISVDKYLNSDNTMSFDGICRFFAGEHFDMSDFSHLDTSPKYQEVYDTLNDEQKKQFLKQYIDFNTGKQLVVEKFCQDLHKPILSHGPNVSVPVVQQSMTMPLLSELQNKITRKIERILLEKPENSLVYPSISHYAYLFDHIPILTIVSVVLTNLVKDATKEGHAWVSQITRRASYHIRSLATRDPKLAALLSLSELFLGTEELMVFSSAILKLTIETEIKSDILESFEISSSDLQFQNRLFVLNYEKYSDDGPGYKKAGLIRAHPFLLRQTHFLEEILKSGEQLFPMLVPPKPWTLPSSGGFLTDLDPLVRSQEPNLTAKYLAQAHIAGQLESTFTSLNALGELPWAINSSMLSAITEIMAVPGGWLNIPPVLSELDKTERPERPKRGEFSNDESYKAAKKIFSQNIQKLSQDLANLRSQRTFYDMTVQIAKSFGKYGSMIFYPQTLDFRGRVYPAVSILSYQGEDFVRSLLTFWEGRALGPNGLNWLKYQLANLYCKQFMSMEDLIKFVEENRHEIISSADSPLNPDLWWISGDNPWQSLALCMEINKVWSFSGNAENYLCRIPIHMDGTCNGLQHYAALGANVNAARSVNLLSGETKSDIYLTVLELVQKSIVKDIELGNPKLAKLAEEAESCVSRKVVKQTVMTTVYGVTLYGAYRQIREKLLDILQDLVSSPRVAELALYLAKQTLNAVGDVFGEAKSIQSFLMQNTLRCISAFDKRDIDDFKKVDFFGSSSRPMMWTSLSGFPVIQTYRKKETKELKTPLQRIALRKSTLKLTIDTRKQLNGIAPNFIHSLDALHLLMTNLAAKNKEIAFAAVHDSFWTHPCDVETLSKIIREEFVRLHSLDVLLNFQKDLQHINREAYQLVWIENSEDPELVKQLENLRSRYSEKAGKRERLNRCLQVEFSDNSLVEALVAKRSPRLIFQTKSNGEGIIYSSERGVLAANRKISFASHTPLLVPLKLAPVPEVGDLDILEVLHSKYFFS